MRIWQVLSILGFLAPTALGGEVPVQFLPLAGPAAARGAEFSGLAWYGDTLLMLPQFPKGALMALEKAALLAALATPQPTPFTPSSIAFDEAGLSGLIPGFAGYEALAVADDQVYLAIETESMDCTMGAWLVSGTIDPKTKAITLQPETRVEVHLAAQRCNMAIEAIAVHESEVFALEEANGVHLTGAPRAHVFDRALKARGTWPMPALEYRVTDATAPDSDGVFWVSNYLWPGDHRKLDPIPDATSPMPAGGTHGQLPQVERLVALQIRDDQIVRADIPPLWLVLDPAAGRNWEGIVRLDDRGFLVVTDEHPATLFGFVPLPMR